jgi:TatD DNase family protein
MLIDAHSHVDRYDLIDGHVLESALAEIAQHRIFTISNSMDLPSYKWNLEISEKCDWVLPAFGVHPWNAPEYVNRLQDLDEAIEQSPIIGEIGLDHYFIKDAVAYPDQSN